MRRKNRCSPAPRLCSSRTPTSLREASDHHPVCLHMTVTKFILVRHGESTWNRDGRIQGQSDSPLSARGISQARALAERLCREPFDALISSDLGRARHTAESIAERAGKQVIFDERLRERHYGIFQGMTLNEAQCAYPDVYARYIDEPVDHVIPGGESIAQCFARNLECLQETATKYAGGQVVVVAHGGVLDGLHRHATGLAYVGTRAFEIVNGSLNWFSYDDGKWRLELWGDAGHLADQSPSEA